MHRGSLAGQLEELGHQALGDLGGQLPAGGVRLPLEAVLVDGALLAGHHVAQVEVQVPAVLLPAYQVGDFQCPDCGKDAPVLSALAPMGNEVLRCEHCALQGKGLAASPLRDA
jgi:predicted RNA-binding Zn-ribbon protein involved in translation (DUF1610 family)